MKLTRLAPLALGGVLLAGGFAGSSLAQQPPPAQGAQAGHPGGPREGRRMDPEAMAAKHAERLRAVLREAGGFDPRFFLYFEDYDLSLRVARKTRIAYVPAVKVVHHGGHAARKGLRHIGLFVRGAATFFRLHGWKWF